MSHLFFLGCEVVFILLVRGDLYRGTLDYFETVAGQPDNFLRVIRHYPHPHQPEIGENLDKIAEVIDAFDRSADLVKYYGTRIQMPSDFLFDVNLKQASTAVEDAIELDRHIFSLAKLAELPAQVYGDVLGQDFVQAITKSGEDEEPQVDSEKLADNLYSLPAPDKAALEEHLAELFR